MTEKTISYIAATARVRDKRVRLAKFAAALKAKRNARIPDQQLRQLSELHKPVKRMLSTLDRFGRANPGEWSSVQTELDDQLYVFDAMLGEASTVVQSAQQDIPWAVH
jgi:SOS-response transcriptional repressor LexA